MRDSLKERINNSREEFDLYPFDSDKEWLEVAPLLAQKKSSKTFRFIGIAALLTLILGFGFLLSFQSDTENSELAEMENYYDGAINQKISLIKNQIDDDSILEDIEEMNIAFSELKADLKDNVDNEEVVTAMMENYRLKLQILEEILKELEKERGEEVL
ncbi:MAG: hypothetical protein HRT61_05625 [Ekhidna sp.]|nr:hypothetical protein [Ekhidna sp.]